MYVQYFNKKKKGFVVICQLLAFAIQQRKLHKSSRNVHVHKILTVITYAEK